MPPRLTASIQVGALLRLAQQQGDFGTILRKGDATSGAILLVGLIRGANPVIYERFPGADGDVKWEKRSTQAASATQAADSDDIQKYLKKRSDQDPDLWIVELDTADEQRLTGLIVSNT